VCTSFKAVSVFVRFRAPLPDAYGGQAMQPNAAIKSLRADVLLADLWL
jgi:hypothetical protein